MDHAAHVHHLAQQSALAHAAVTRADADQPVPTCPGWSVADLTWHLAEVQWFWASVVDRLVLDPDELTPPERPVDGALAAALGDQTSRLVAALTRRRPDERCWSWHADGWSVGWVGRRQAHEALIHRVDAELAAGADVTPPSTALAADGVAEMVEVMLDLPAWGAFTPDGTAARLTAEDAGAAWLLALGRFQGTDPETGTDHDLDYARTADPEEVLEVVGEVTGTAWDLDRWVWGRGPLDRLRSSGAADLPDRLRSITTVD
jgi:uncharacterized protein (TIGR03083 family)